MKTTTGMGKLVLCLALGTIAGLCNGCIDVSGNRVKIADNAVLSNNQDNGNDNLAGNLNNGNENGRDNVDNLTGNDASASGLGNILPGVTSALPQSPGPTTDEPAPPPAPEEEVT